MSAECTLSLEDHLARALRPLVAMLPDALAAELKDVLDSPLPFGQAQEADPPSSPNNRTPTAPYSLLTAISKWSRTPDAERAFSSHDPPLRVQDYSIVALLAGTRTDPNRRFPHVTKSSTESIHAAHRREAGDRRALTALVNALLSVVGSALATWWAATSLAWRNEWKVLLALSVAIIVASSEAILFVIWRDRQNKPAPARRLPRLRDTPVSDASHQRQLDKKIDPEPSSTAISYPRSRDTAVVTATSAHLSGTTQGVLRGRAAINDDLSGQIQYPRQRLVTLNVL